MNLANDILRRASGVSLVKAAPVRGPIKLDYPKQRAACPRTKKPVAREVVVKPSVPGASWDKQHQAYRAYFYDGIKTHWLGHFGTIPRALIAVKLYAYWEKKKYEDIPHIPENRPYRRKINPNY